MVQITEKVYIHLHRQLLASATPLHQKFRVLFTLRSINTHRSIDIISDAFVLESALLKHELAYVLGQMQDIYAIPILNSILSDLKQESMVRHEAAEALGAICNPSSLDILNVFLHDGDLVVGDTCRIAIDKIHGRALLEERSGKFASVDPAPPYPSSYTLDVLKSLYLDTTKSLYDRYRAMFSLRDLGSLESVEILAVGLDDANPLFRHEVAYVFGQMLHPASIPFLMKRLSDESEIGMVRHECAEALGSMGEVDQCTAILRHYENDPVAVVRESCIVALDMASDEFQYANALETL